MDDDCTPRTDATDALARGVAAGDESGPGGALRLRRGHHPEAYAALGRMTRLRAGGDRVYRAQAMPADLQREAARRILDASFPGDPFAR
jgi:hypothetical protein